VVPDNCRDGWFVLDRDVVIRDSGVADLRDARRHRDARSDVLANDAREELPAFEVLDQRAAANLRASRGGRSGVGRTGT
jgi:hypothetical protein